MMITKIITAFSILIIAIYIGVGGLVILENDQKYEKAKEKPRDPNDTTTYSYQGIPFKTQEAVEAYIQQNQAFKLFPHLRNTPSFLNFFITSIAFGVIGAFSKLTNSAIKSNEKISNTKNLLLICAQGGLIGIIILSISYIVPKLLISEDIELKPITVVFLSLLGGISYLEFFAWIESLIQKRIKNANDQHP